MSPVGSSTFLRALQRAVAVIAGRGRLASLLRAASRRLGEDHGALRGLLGDVAGLIRMTRESVRGRYRRLPVGSLVAVVAALIYLVNPLDVIPDIIPVIGFADDAVILLWVLSRLRKDLDAFLAWEREWGDVIDVEASAVTGPPELPNRSE